MSVALSNVFRRLGAALAVALAATALPSMALADWMKAESANFIIYSDGSERELRAMVTELERFDGLLKVYLQRDADAQTYRKLPIYVVQDRDIATILGKGTSGIGGIYIRTGTDVFAVSRRDQDLKILKHEYAHHFMYQQFNYPYPAWFTEGFAEFFATAEFTAWGANVGKPYESNVNALNYLAWMDVDQLISNRYSGKARRSSSFYPMSWLLTHWFLSTPERRDQLSQYITSVGQGTASVDAMTNATGLTPDQLKTQLQRYLNGRLRYARLEQSLLVPDMTITRLPQSANELLLLTQKISQGIGDEADQAQSLQLVRQYATRLPHDADAQLALGIAELNIAKDLNAAETALDAALAIAPQKVEVLQWLARLSMNRAHADDDMQSAVRLQAKAQQYLGQAYQLDDANLATFILMAQNRAGTPGYPTQNDLDTLQLAHLLAPQMPNVALNYAQALIEFDLHEHAVPLLQVLANDPHRQASDGILELLQRARRLTPEQIAAEQALGEAQDNADDAANDSEAETGLEL